MTNERGRGKGRRRNGYDRGKNDERGFIIGKRRVKFMLDGEGGGF